MAKLRFLCGTCPGSKSFGVDPHCLYRQKISVGWLCSDEHFFFVIMEIRRSNRLYTIFRRLRISERSRLTTTPSAANGGHLLKITGRTGASSSIKTMRKPELIVHALPLALATQDVETMIVMNRLVRSVSLTSKPRQLESGN